MAFKCAHCRSADVVTLLDKRGCLNCGKQTTEDGKPVAPKKKEK